MECLVTKNCCFYYDLRKGLLVWGYLNFLRYIIMDTTAISICLLRLIGGIRNPGDEDYADLRSIFIVFILTGTLALLNFVVNILFLVGAHKKQICKLKAVLGISIFQLFAYAIFLIVGNLLYEFSEDIALWITRHVDPVSVYMAIDIPAIAVLDIVFKVYILLLIRSLYISIRDDSEQRAFFDTFDGDGGGALPNRNVNTGSDDVFTPKRQSSAF